MILQALIGEFNKKATKFLKAFTQLETHFDKE
jgi:hypothetical protein